MMLFKQLVKSKGLDYIHCVGTNPYIRGEETAEDIKTKIQQYSNAIIDSIFFDELDEKFGEVPIEYLLEKFFQFFQLTE